MIQFQKGYTTPEQSKKLLTLGVPIDSADMYYKHTMLAPYILSDGVLFSVYSKVEDIIPCWSVGRLINIYCTCRGCTWEYITNNPPIEDILCDIELYIREMDFSKFEE